MAIPQWLLDHDSDEACAAQAEAIPNYKAYKAALALSFQGRMHSPYAADVRRVSDYCQILAASSFTGDFRVVQQFQNEPRLLSLAHYKRLHGPGFAAHSFLSGPSRPLHEVFQNAEQMPFNVSECRGWFYHYVPGHVALLTADVVPVGIQIVDDDVQTLTAQAFRALLRQEDARPTVLLGNFVFGSLEVSVPSTDLYSPDEEDYGTYSETLQ